MTNSKQTRKALYSSVLSLLLCFVMLIGTTFAWFTDTASTSVNKIQAGKLDVDIVNSSGTSLKNTTLDFHDADNETNILWEPGATFKTFAFKIKNNGNLALKYKLEINGVDGDANLLQVINFNVVDEKGSTVSLENFEKHLNADAVSEAYYIQATMNKDADNKYQGLTLDGIAITVVATQDTVEKDIKDNTYDDNADYGKVFTVSSFEDLEVAAKNAVAGDTISLAKDINVTKGVVFLQSGITFNGNGHTITCNSVDDKTGVIVLKFGDEIGEQKYYCTGVTVKDLTITGKGARAMNFYGGTSSLLENVKVTGSWWVAVNFNGTHGAVMNNCNIKTDSTNKYCSSSVFANEQSANQLILNNTQIDDVFVNATANGASYGNNGIKLVVNDGSSITTLHTNENVEETRTFYKVNGSNAGVGSVQKDIQ